MKGAIFGSLLAITVLHLEANLPEEKAQQKLSSKHYKEAIKAYNELLENEKGEKRGEYFKQLAKAYYLDQEQVKAFESFLQALEANPRKENSRKENPLLSQDEKVLYEEALKIYLDPKERNSEAIALKLRDLYAGVLRLNPRFFHLGYLVAIAYANLSQFEPFFDIFYRSYSEIPDHFLAYKVKGVLHIKLFERGKTPEAKEESRHSILSALQKAKEKFPKDVSLYRMQIAFSPEGEKGKILEVNLKEMIREHMIIPRGDLPFYFDLLFAYGQLDLAEELLKSSKAAYPYSRTLDAAGEMLKEKTSQSRGADGATSTR